LLARCQSRTGKAREALENIRQAIALEADEPLHHVLAMQILLATGQVKLALEHLSQLESKGFSSFDVMLGWVQAHVLSGDFSQATQRAQLLENQYPGAANLVRLGWLFLESERDDMRQEARRYFGLALQNGFYPEAMTGLARLEYQDKNYDNARCLLLSAINLTRERPPEAAHPLSLLGRVCEGLLAMGEPLPNCRAWMATLSLAGITDAPNHLLLLVCHQTLEAAKEYVRDFYQALNPGHEWSHSLATWDFAATEQQPNKPSVPGIYMFQIG